MPDLIRGTTTTVNVGPEVSDNWPGANWVILSPSGTLIASDRIGENPSNLWGVTNVIVDVSVDVKVPVTATIATGYTLVVLKTGEDNIFFESPFNVVGSGPCGPPDKPIISALGMLVSNVSTNRLSIA